MFDYGYLKHFSDKTVEECCNKIFRGNPRKVPYNKEERVQMFFRVNKFSYEKLKVFEKILNMSINVNKIFHYQGFRGNKT